MVKCRTDHESKKLTSEESCYFYCATVYYISWLLELGFDKKGANSEIEKQSVDLQVLCINDCYEVKTLYFCYYKEWHKGEIVQ